MTARRLRQLGDPVLREVSAAVANPAAEAELLADLRATLHAFQRTRGFGRGISAVQIGEPKRLIYIESGAASFCLFNPVYERTSEITFELWDDCFSFPDLLVWVRRHRAVRVQYLDEKGAARALDAEGDLAELLQHEMDHLDGVLAVDRALDAQAFATREEWLRRGAPRLSRW